MNAAPIRSHQLRPPRLRGDLLRRERLAGWLEGAAAGRVALVVGEAGFGKTTLIADWARRTRRLTTWYGLEPDDRDWLTFVRHLLAAGREIDPGFAQTTFDLMAALGPGGSSQEEIVESIADELSEFGRALPTGLALILDDLHVIDGAPDTDPVVRALIERTGDGFSLVIAARTTPSIVRRSFRAEGGLARIDGDDLRFRVPETIELFRDAYGRDLEADLVAQITDRTRGWPALLALVNATLAGRDPREAAELVRELQPARGEVASFIGEVILGCVPPDLRRFLGDVALLESLEQASVAHVSGQPTEVASAFISQAAHHGLVAESETSGPPRLNPLVHGHLLHTREQELGPVAWRTAHLALARFFESRDWHAAARHFALAGAHDEVERVIGGALPAILAGGDALRAERLLHSSSSTKPSPVSLVIESRGALARGHYEKARAAARMAVSDALDPRIRGTALLNLAAVLGVAGFDDEAHSAAQDALEFELTDEQRNVARATVALRQAAVDGDLAAAAEELRRLAARHALVGHHHDAAVSFLNLATVLLWVGDCDEACEAAARSCAYAREDAHGELVLVAALAVSAREAAHRGDFSASARLVEEGRNATTQLARAEAVIEAGLIHAELGALHDATSLLQMVEDDWLPAEYTALLRLARCHAALRSGSTREAEAELAALRASPCRDVAGGMRTVLLHLRTTLMLGMVDDAAAVPERLSNLAASHGSRPGLAWARLGSAIARGRELDRPVLEFDARRGVPLAPFADEVAAQLHHLGAGALAHVASEASLQPSRWREALRRQVEIGAPSATACARLLTLVGGEDDAIHLRTLSGTRKALRPFAAAITRRLAAPVHIEDLGPIRVQIGGQVPDSTPRRKALCLASYLVAQPGMAAPRDEVIEAIWPDLSPETAGNSLHQTIYFLRRVFEPDFREGLSAGYVPLDGEVVSLDRDLITSSSRQCWDLLTKTRPSDEDSVGRLVGLYRGRFALDFTYDEWSCAYRDTLHAAVLARADEAMQLSIERGALDFAIEVGQSILAVDPGADSVELSLVRAYKRAGRIAAALEQYGHYAVALRRDLALDPPDFEDL